MTEYFPPFVGGGQIHAAEIINHLKGSYRFEVITNAIADTRSFEKLDGFTVHRVGVPGNVDSFTRRFRYILAARSLAIKIHNRDPFDIVHSHVFAGSIAGYFFSRKAKVPILNTVHGIYLDDPTIGYLKRAFQKYIMTRNYSKSIAVSEMTRRQLINLGANQDSIEVVYNGVNVSLFGRTESKQNEVFTVAYIGRLWKIKGVHLLVDAAVNLSKTENIHFILVGDGPLRTELEKKIASNGLEKSVTITGFKRYEDVPSILQSADLFVLPSLMEGLPNSMLEAMASRVAVVATAVGGIPEIITNMENGLLINANSVDEISGAILRLARESSLRSRLAQNGFQMVKERFKWSDAASRVSEFYEMLIKSHNS